MKKAVKIIYVILAFALILSLTACSGGSTNQQAGSSPASTASSVASSSSEDWTFKNRIEIMVPAGEGGGLDTTLRKFAPYLEKELGVAISINNRSGGSGVTGYTWSYNSTNDGYAFQFTAPSAIISAAQGNFNFDFMNELIPVSGLVMAEGMFFAGPKAPFKNAEEMIAYCKANPGKVSIAVDTPNGISGAIVAEFEKAAGIELKWVTSESGEDTISVIAGDIDMCVNTWSDTGAYAKSGDLTPIIVMAGQRNPAYPDVPCSAELGYTTTLGYYRVFTAMKGTPQAAIDAFAAAVHKVATENEEWKEWLATNGMTNDYLWTAEELAQVFKNTYDSAVALNS
ncbi:MAG TPA: tripartite tricarboxylate transporter substrate binding protein [Clostridiales bacterium]|nr:tripartite tricarboxylate transporter substrate binding protein [Clostridiales bacterium]